MTRLTPAIALAIALAACGEPEQPASPVVAGLDRVGVGPTLDALLFGSDSPCRDGPECPSGQCLFGRCAGLARADEPWRAELVLDRLVELVSARPETRDLLVATLAQLSLSGEVSLPTRARFIRALERLSARAQLAALAAQDLPPSIADALALSRIRLGELASLPHVVGLLDAPRPSVVVDAIRALGAAPDLPETNRAEAAAALLGVLTGDVPHVHARAALDALVSLGFKPAARAILDFAPSAPDALRDVTFTAVSALTGAAHGRDLAAWQRWVDASGLAAPPPFTPRTRTADEDIGLPDP